MADVPNDDKAVLFGGRDDNWVVRNETWIYDYSDNEWYNVTCSEAPPARYESAMSGMEKSGKILLFGGTNRSNYLFDDTWIFDASSNRWTQKFQIDRPPQRFSHCMSPVAENGSVILFGGASVSGYDLRDTWIYDCQTYTWHNRTRYTSPEARRDFAMATYYDSNEIILCDGGMGPDTWIYNISSGEWRVVPLIVLPPNRLAPCLGTGRAMHEVILFGGTENFNFPSDTWQLNSTIFKVSGTYISPMYETERSSNLTSLSWDATVPNETRIDFQVRTANSLWNLSYEQFRGPGGLPNNTYRFNSSAESSHYGDNFVQYKIVFQSNPIQTLTPVVRSVRVEYSLFPGSPLPVSPSDNDWQNTTRPSFEWNFIDIDDSIQDGYEWELFDAANRSLLIMSSGAINTSDTSHVPDEPLQDGIWLWHVRTRDPAFNWGPFCDLQTVKIDTVPPVWADVNVTPAGWTNGPCVISYSASDDTSGVESYLAWIDSRSIDPQNGSMTLDDLPDGIHSILLRACDRAGNFANMSARAYYDGTAPEPFVPVLSQPSWSRTDPELAFETVDNTSGLDRFEIIMDGKSFSVEKSPLTLSNLSEGATNLTIRAYDRAGNFRDSSISVYVDRTPPIDLIISATPAGWTNTTPEIRFSAMDNISDIDHYQVMLNNGTWFNRTSPFIPDDFPEGINNIRVRAIDRAGNYEEGTVMALYDRTPPVWSDVRVEPASWTRVLPTLIFNATDNVSGPDHYEMSLDGTVFKKVSSPYKFSALSEGAHNITIRAIDKAGNLVELVLKTFIDTKAPFNLELKVAKGTKSEAGRNVTLEVSAEDATSGVEMMCFSNNGTEYSAWEPFTNSKVWTLAAGDDPKIVLVKVRDRAGNEALPVSVSIELPNDGQETPWVMLSAVAILLSLVIVGMAVIRKRQKRQ